MGHPEVQAADHPGSLLERHTLKFAVVLFCVAAASTVIMTWRVTLVQLDLVERTALEQAKLHTDAIAAFRTLYTSEVVEGAEEAGLQVTHDYEGQKGVIPLPATLSIKLAQHLGKEHQGVGTELYSPFPFPWRRETGGLRDDFQRDAWRRLVANPSQPFYRFEEIEGRQSLRYATADVMRSSCVACHNRQPDTPRTGWREGDVRGVLEVALPVDSAVAQAQAAIVA